MVDPNAHPLVYNKAELLNGQFYVAASVAWLKQVGLLA